MQPQMLGWCFGILKFARHFAALQYGRQLEMSVEERAPPHRRKPVLLGPMAGTGVLRKEEGLVVGSILGRRQGRVCREG